MDSEAPIPGDTGRERRQDKAAPDVAPAVGRALIRLPVQPARAWFTALKPSHGAAAAAVAAVLGLGFVGGTALFAARTQTAALAPAGPSRETQMDVLYRVQNQVQSLKASFDGLRSATDGRQTEDTIRSLKRSVDVLKSELDGVKTASNGAVGQLSAKIDKLDRDPGPKLAEISARLDKFDRDPSPKLNEIAARLDKLADLTSRVDRIERQVSTPAATGSIAAPAAVLVPVPPKKLAGASPAPSPTGPVPAAVRAEQVARAETPTRAATATRAEAPTRAATAARQEVPAKPATLDGWLLRDVYGGVALVEGRAGGLREVAPGEYVPGVGEIRSIERRGRSWVVVTSRGVIQTDSRW